MRDRLAALKRMMTVYEMVEEAASAEARGAAAAAGIARKAVQSERGQERRARFEAREAVDREDQLGRSAGAIDGAMAERRRIQLEPILEECESTSDAAKERHLASRIWSQRMKRLVDEACYQLAGEENRRAQKAADDRFLAQRRTRSSRPFGLRNR
jgi:hypothetical protein